MHEERKIKDINFYCTVLFVYKCKHNRLPLVCNQFLTDNNYIADGSYNLRSVNEYIIPFSRTNMRTKCMNVLGPKQWRNLPDVVRNAASLSNFKTTFFSFVFAQY